VYIKSSLLFHTLISALLRFENRIQRRWFRSTSLAVHSQRAILFESNGAELFKFRENLSISEHLIPI
jgi:hypothetical protein